MASVVRAGALSGGDVLAVVEPGVLRVSRDGGGTFRSAGVPAGVAVGVSVRDGDAVVQTTAGAYRWRDGQLEVIPAGPTTERWIKSQISATSSIPTTETVTHTITIQSVSRRSVVSSCWFVRSS